MNVFVWIIRVLKRIRAPFCTWIIFVYDLVKDSSILLVNFRIKPKFVRNN